LLTRPFEFVLLVAIVILFFVPMRSLAIAALVLLPAFGLMLLQNKQVTGSWTTLPYQLSRYQYGIPATFTFQQNPIPHRPLTVEQQIDYDAQIDVHGKTTDTVGSYLARLGGRVRFYRFFFLAPLYLAVPWFLPALRQYRFAWIVIALGLLWLGDAFYPYFYPHYIAAATCVFLLVSVISLEKVSRWNREAATLILVLCLAHFVFWYGVHLNGNPNLLLALSPEESWDSIDNYSAGYSDLTGRIAINNRLAAEAGKQLVFVRYYPQRTAREWIQNAADIDQSRVVWALDLGPDEDAILRRYYRDRHAWLLEPDAVPPKLTPLL
jgi:predicted PurR-regulated permease PerM